MGQQKEHGFNVKLRKLKFRNRTKSVDRLLSIMLISIHISDMADQLFAQSLFSENFKIKRASRRFQFCTT
jgi:hypothetical protein